MVEITRPSSRLKNTNIGDLPDAALVEILSRLPCYKYIARCKCVSKHWCSFMSDPSFIRRFLCIQSDAKQTFMTSTLINCQGEEFLARMSSSFKALTPLFQRLMYLHHLKEEPVVVGSYNDLVLCCASRYYQRDYYICNPYTFECVPLPPPPLVTEVTGVGILCDLPYYKCKKNDLGGHDIQINAECRCRVVRIIFQRVSEMHMRPSCEFKVQIFSFETGVWRESIVSSPSRFNSYDVNHRFSFAHNGVLYWLSDSGDFLIGLNPFMMDNRTKASSSTVDGEDSDHHYEILFTKIDRCTRSLPKFLGLYKGCLQIGDYSYGTHAVHAWEFHEEFHSGSGKLLMEQRRRIYPLVLDIIPDDNSFVDIVGFDPNNDGNEGEGILYLLVLKDVDIDTHGDIFMCNILTRKCLKIFENHCSGHDYFTVAVPWWPTPVPRLPEREANPLVPPRLD